MKYCIAIFCIMLFGSFSRPPKPANTAHTFSKIMLASSGCFGTCPMELILIDSNRNVLFQGIRYTNTIGLYTAKMPERMYKHILEAFSKVDIDTLKNRYETRWTDLETITVLFEKNGKIYKSIEDYGHKAPYEYQAAYTYLRNVYSKLKLKQTLFPDSTEKALFYYFTQGKYIYYLNGLQSMLLYDYLRNGVATQDTYTAKYELKEHSYTMKLTVTDTVPTQANISSDGRYYTIKYKNKKPVTIDIGFNFFERNMNMFDKDSTDAKKPVDDDIQFKQIK